MMQFPVALTLAGIVVVLAWILNLSAICAMRSLHSRTQTTYGHFGSFCVANLFLSTINFPPSIISHILVSKPVQHYLCVTWIYLDTLLCNVMILHILGSSLDSYLRMRHQPQYQSSRRDPVRSLKLCAPWTLGFIQSTSFIVIAQISDSAIEEDICAISDPNFLILRSVMCFGVPISGSAVLVFLSAKGLSETRGRPIITALPPRKGTSECIESNLARSARSTLDHPCMVRDETLETITRSCGSGNSSSLIPLRPLDCTQDLGYYHHQCPRHGVLSVPMTTTVPLPQISESTNPRLLGGSLCQACPHSSPMTDSTLPYTFLHMTSSTNPCPDLIPMQSSPSPSENPPLSIHQSKSSGNLQGRVVEASFISPSQSANLQQMRNSWSGPANVDFNIQRHPSSVPKEEGPLTPSERTTVATNLSLCISTLIFWGPFIIGSLIHGVCRPPYCMFSIVAARINEFKWLSYGLSVIYPLLLVVTDGDLRSEIRSSVSW